MKKEDLQNNFNSVRDALDFKLCPILAGFVGQTLTKEYKKDWWQDGVLDELYDYQKMNLPLSGSYSELIDKLDIKLCLLLMDRQWKKIFINKLPLSYFNWIKEMGVVRNQCSHNEFEHFDDAYTARAFDTMARLCKPLDEETAMQLRDMWREKLYGSVKGSTNVEIETPPPQAEEPTIPSGGFKSWREVMRPHPDVSEGRYKQAEFAADLAQVARGEGAVEYVDPVEFFSRTYLTDGLKNLLVQALKRLSNGDGDPVIQLKTSFGGGKTHSMLALYHLFRGMIRPAQSQAIVDILNAAQVAELPKVRVAVLVGTWLSTVQLKNQPTQTKATLWGEIASQLTKPTDEVNFYEYIREADEHGVSPGVEALKNLFDSAGTCLILIDELVAYGRKLRNEKGHSAGTFDNLMVFIQELTEAARASKNSMVVATLPESKAEVGDELGALVLKQVEKTFGRMESVWKPVTADESFEIVRRRLFLPRCDEAARDEICTAFSNMYSNNASDFPYESRQIEYKNKMAACYPIHPEYFAYLYDKWSTIEGFQKTRGVLRLMATVIHHLWINGDSSPIIMPGNTPLNIPQVQEELIKLLKGNWNAIVDSEIDGKNSIPLKLDRENVYFGKLSAARRVARTIFMGSAPNAGAQTIKGLEENHIRLGVMLPHEKDSIATFNDALSKLKSNLYYMYSSGTRFWFDTSPTLRKYVEDKEDQIKKDEVEMEIEARLKRWWTRTIFANIHFCPEDSSKIPDEQVVRLVVLPINFTHERGNQNSTAMKTIADFLDNRGNIPRMHRNMLLFMVPDELKTQELEKVVRRFKAWQKVREEAANLNLNITQIREADERIKDVEDTLKIRLSQAYRWLFAPYTKMEDMKTIRWDVFEIECTKEENITKAAEKFVNEEILIPAFGALRLRMAIIEEFFDLIWQGRDAIELNQLWGFFSDYCYLPRLRDKEVLLGAVRKGIESGDFALAESFDGKKYVNLRINENFSGTMIMTYLLVKKEVAYKYIEPPPVKETPTNVSPQPTTPQKKEKKNRHFSMDFELKPDRIDKDFKNCIEEVLSHLLKLPEVEANIHLSVKVEVPNGTPNNVVNIVTENCQTLKVGSFHFDE